MAKREKAKIDRLDDLWQEIKKETGISTYYLDKIIDYCEEEEYLPNIFRNTKAQKLLEKWWKIYQNEE